MTVTVDRTVEEFTAAPRKLFINGQWTDAASGKTFATPNPATGETLANVAGIKLGPGMESGTQMGPLVSEEQLRRVTGFLDSAGKTAPPPSRAAGAPVTRATSSSLRSSPTPGPR